MPGIQDVVETTLSQSTSIITMATNAYRYKLILSDEAFKYYVCLAEFVLRYEP